jgi:hypothetical protein
MYRRLLDFARKQAAASGHELRAINLQKACDRQGLAA